jgi:hypothetical protein
MPKKKDKDGAEFWRGKYRELEKEVRQLRKQVKYFSNRDHLNEKTQYDEEIIKDSEDTSPLKRLKRCPDCYKGYMEEFEILGKCFGTCNICGYREKLK